MNDQMKGQAGSCTCRQCARGSRWLEVATSLHHCHRQRQQPSASLPSVLSSLSCSCHWLVLTGWRWIAADDVLILHRWAARNWKASPSQSAGTAPLQLSWFGHSTWRRARRRQRNICQCWHWGAQHDAGATPAGAPLLYPPMQHCAAIDRCTPT